MQMCLMAKTVCNWDGLTKCIDNGILDQGGTGTKEYLSLLSKLTFDPWRHMTYSIWFLMEADQLTLILSQCDLVASSQIDDHYVTGILTGRVDQWERAFKTFCHSSQIDREIRGFFNVIMLYMEAEGIKFPSSKKELKDRTFEVK